MDDYQKLLDKALNLDNFDNTSEPVPLIKGKTRIIRTNNINNDEPIKYRKIFKRSKKNNGEFITKLIVKAFWWSIWKKQVKILKYSVKGYNKKRANFRNLMDAIFTNFDNHKYEYFYELIDNMKQLPRKPGVIHDPNYGKIKLINNLTMAIKATSNIRFIAKLNFILKINLNLYEILMDTFDKMIDLRKNKT